MPTTIHKNSSPFECGCTVYFFIFFSFLFVYFWLWDCRTLCLLRFTNTQKKNKGRKIKSIYNMYFTNLDYWWCCCYYLRWRRFICVSLYFVNLLSLWLLFRCSYHWFILLVWLSFLNFCLFVSCFCLLSFASFNLISF